MMLEYIERTELKKAEGIVRASFVEALASNPKVNAKFREALRETMDSVLRNLNKVINDRFKDHEQLVRESLHYKFEYKELIKHQKEIRELIDELDN